MSHCSPSDGPPEPSSRRGPDTEENAILNDSFCDNSSGAVSTYASSTEVSGNAYDRGGGGGGGGGDGGPIATGTYYVTNVNSGKVMDVYGGGTSDGDNIIQWADNGADNQRWYINDQGGGEYTIEAVHSGKVADVEGASTADDANVLQWSSNGGANQRWTFQSV